MEGFTDLEWGGLESVKLPFQFFYTFAGKLCFIYRLSQVLLYPILLLSQIRYLPFIFLLQAQHLALKMAIHLDFLLLLLILNSFASCLRAFLHLSKRNSMLIRDGL